MVYVGLCQLLRLHFGEGTNYTKYEYGTLLKQCNGKIEEEK